MREIILMMSVSLDGYLETADRDFSWCRVDDEILGHLNGQFRTMGAFMFGRVTRALMAGYWPLLARIRASRRNSWSSPGSGARCPSSSFHGPSRRQTGIPR